MEKMTLKELVEYEKTLGSLQQEYEGKLRERYNDADSPDWRKRTVTVLNLIIQERQKVNQQKYLPVEAVL